MDSGLSWTVDYLSFGLWIVDSLGHWIICLLVIELDNGLSVLWSVDSLILCFWIVDWLLVHIWIVDHLSLLSSY